MDASIYQLRHRDVLTLCVLALLALGVIMVQSASSTVTGGLHQPWTPLAQNFLTSSRYEYLFWEMAWNMADWPA